MPEKTVRDVMMPEPWTVDASTPIDDSAHRMRAWKVREVYVTEGGELLGVLTDEDIILFAIASGRHPSMLTAGECAYPDVCSVAADDPVDRAVDLMRGHGLDRLPVVDGKQLVGSVWLTDLAITSPESPRVFV